MTCRQSISFKLSGLVFRSLHNSTPHYIASLINHCSPVHHIWSSTQNLLAQPRVHSTIGSRLFSSAGPRLNALLDYVKNTDSFHSFKSHLKTHHFTVASGTNGHQWTKVNPESEPVNPAPLIHLHSDFVHAINFLLTGDGLLNQRFLCSTFCH